MSNQNSSANSGFPLAMVLFIVFLVLKLTDTIDWSWWWVTSPLWIPVLLLFVVGLLIGGVYAVVVLLKKNAG